MSVNAKMLNDDQKKKMAEDKFVKKAEESKSNLLKKKEYFTNISRIFPVPSKADDDNIKMEKSPRKINYPSALDYNLVDFMGMSNKEKLPVVTKEISQTFKKTKEKIKNLIKRKKRTLKQKILKILNTS